MGKGDGGKDKSKDKKSKDSKGEEYKFEVPDFDEDAFIHKELVSFKTTAVLFGWGIVAALLSWLVYSVMNGDPTAWYLGLAIVAVMGYLLRFVYARLNIDISHFGRKEWLGTAFLLFFTWLAFSMLLLNPPISDHEPPQVEVLVSPPFQQLGGPVAIDVFYLDNGGIHDPAFTLTHGGNELVSLSGMEKLSNNHYRYEFTPTVGGTYAYAAQATGGGGRTTVVDDEINVSGRALVVELPDGDRIDQTPDTVFVRFSDTSIAPCHPNPGARAEPCHLNVVLDMLDSDRQVVLQYDESLGGWKATANFAGWVEGNNTFQVVSEMQARGFGPYVLEPGLIVHPGPFSIDFSAIPGDFQVPLLEQNIVPPNARNVPGPELLVVVGAIALVAAVRRRQIN